MSVSVDNKKLKNINLGDLDESLAANLFEVQPEYKESKHVFCKITYPTLPENIRFARNVLCTVLSQTHKMGGNCEPGSTEDPRLNKLRNFLASKAEEPALNLKHMLFTAAKCPVRLGYSARLYDVSHVSEGETLRDIKEMYLKEDEIVVRTKLGGYDIVDAISGSDAVEEYKKIYERLQGGEQKVIDRQVDRGFFKELDCYLIETNDKGQAVGFTQVDVKTFNRLMDQKDETTGHNLYNSDSFAFFYKDTKKNYNGEFTIHTVVENGDEINASYTFRTYNPKLDR